jgi:hypothetical protein
VKDGKATGDNAELLRALSKLGKQFREDGVLKGGSTPSGDGMDPAAAKAQIAKLQANDDFKKVWLTKGATGKVDGKDMTHAEAVAEMTRLYQLANPEQPQAKDGIPEAGELSASAGPAEGDGRAVLKRKARVRHGVLETRSRGAQPSSDNVTRSSRGLVTTAAAGTRLPQTGVSQCPLP